MAAHAAIAAFAGIPLDAEMEVQSMDRELNLSTLRVDNPYRCRPPGEDFLIHFEAVSRYRDEVLDWQVDYVKAIIAKYKLPCRSYLLLLTEGGVPERFPRHLEFRYGNYEARVRRAGGAVVENTCETHSGDGTPGTVPMDGVDGGYAGRVSRSMAETGRDRRSEPAGPNDLIEWASLW